MCIRSIIAILNHNYKTKKQKPINDQIKYSKPLRKYTLKNVNENEDTDWQ